MIWVLLEINTLSFCSMVFKKRDINKIQSKERLMKYFVVQSIASSLLILSCFFGVGKVDGNRNLFSVFLLVIVMSLIIKIGAVPFHFWFISVSKKRNWMRNKVLFTWQKLLPIYLIIFQLKKMVYPFILFSVIFGSVFLINKKSFKEILALSSVFNLGWMLCAIRLRLKILISFSFIYWMRLIFFIEEISKRMNSSFNEKSSRVRKVLLFLKTTNLAGIPPLILFMVKWLTFSRLLKFNLTILATFILILRRINVFVYLRMASRVFLLVSFKSQKYFLWGSSFRLILFLFLNILILPVLMVWGLCLK